MGAGEAAVEVGSRYSDGRRSAWRRRRDLAELEFPRPTLGGVVVYYVFRRSQYAVAGNPESVASRGSRVPRDRIVAPVAAGLTELDGLVPGPLAAEDAKYRVKQHGQEPGRARSEDRGFGAPTFAHASRARGPEPAGLPRAGQESTRRRPRPDESKSAEPRASRRRRGRDPPADGTRSEITTRLRRRLITRFTSVTTSERFTEFTK